jgi:indole-3-glycerol phosphate synthase
MTGVAAPSVLDRILANKRAEVAEAMRRRSLPRVREKAATARPPARDFLAALRTPPGAGPPRLIAEIKKSSPSRADLAPTLDVRETARSYARAGASAISVLTDSRFFGGSLEDLEAVRQEVDLPLLRKDFLIHPYQLFEARAAGADAALLIVAALASPLGSPEGLDDAVEPGGPDFGAARERLEALLEGARAAGVAGLVEVHDLPEMEVARAAGAVLIGINNRDLRTLETHLEVTERLAPAAPAGAILVSESGVETGADVRRLRRAGASAVLVGSALVSAPDPAARVRELLR